MQNLIAAIGALGSALPRAQRFSPSDLVLSIDSLSRSYPLCLMMNALFSGASIALNSVAGEKVDFALATVGVSPTVIIASSQTMSDYHDSVMQPQTGLVSSVGRWVQARTLDAGNMPSKNIFSQLARVGPTSELSLDKLRLLCISHRIDAPASARLSSKQLTDLRIYTDARIAYALTGSGIAGAIAQTNVFDYRRHDGPSHFGSPLSSIEITLTEVSEDTVTDTPEGQVRLSWSNYFKLHILLTSSLRSKYLALQLSVVRLHSHLESVLARTTLWSCALERPSYASTFNSTFKITSVHPHFGCFKW